MRYSDPQSEDILRKYPEMTWRFPAIFGDFQGQKSQKLTELRCQLKEFAYMSYSIRTYMCTNICVHVHEYTCMTHI